MIKQFAKLIQIKPQIFSLSNINKYKFTSMDVLKKLRDETGSPIINVKKALEQFSGDYDKAKNFLIEKGLASAQKKLSKETREGVIGIQVSQNRQYGIIGEFNCETDFVARNELFQDFVNTVLQSFVQNTKQINLVEETDEQKQKMLNFLQESTINGQISENKTETIDKIRQLIISKLQENINVRKLASLSINNGIIGFYVHNSLRQGIGGKACIVQIEGLKHSDQYQQFADSIALQILGMRPDYIKKEDIPQEELQKERERIKQEFGDVLKGKNEQVVKNMVEGKLKKYYEENVLLEQTLVTDQEKDAKSIGTLIKEINKKENSNINIQQFHVWTVKS